MKKLISILFVFLFLFSACKKTSIEEQSTTTLNQETSDSKNLYNLTASLTNATENIISSNQTTNPQNNNVSVSYETSDLSKENIQSSSPIYIHIGIDELKEIKTAYDSMPADAFQSYMETNHIDTYMTGMWDYQNSTALLDEICSTYLPVLDNNLNNVSELGFYWKNNRIYQLIIFDGDMRASVIINTTKNTENKELQLGNEALCLSEKRIEKNNYSAYLYEYKNADYQFYAEVFAEDTYIILRSIDIETMEDFEICFNRLTFVKTEDLIAD